MRDIDFNSPNAAELIEGEKAYSGVADDIAIDVKTPTAEEVKQATCELNNNHAGDSDYSPN